MFNFGSRFNFKNHKLDTDMSVNRVILVGNCLL
ncbi:single-stranded DNA-binding protein, partial [Bacteroides ovatus]